MSRPVLTQATGPAHTRILGIGGVRGELTVTNDDVAGPIDSSDEWIRQRTGIVTRRRAAAGTDVIDLAVEASIAAIADAGLTGTDIDAVLLATTTYFHQTPAGACLVADRVGATPAAAYDLSAACAGYSYGVAQADALVRSGAARHVLVIGAEKMSDFIDPTDRSISFLLGDGAGAVVIGPSDTPGIGPTVWGSDGGQASLITQTHSWKEAFEQQAAWPTLRQEGASVFKWASFQMAGVAARAMVAAGVTPEQVEAFIPHQANMRIIDQMIKQLKLPGTVVVARDIAETGNTSSASIPLATERLLREGLAPHGAVALQIGFGAGLAYAAQVVVLP